MSQNLFSFASLLTILLLLVSAASSFSVNPLTASKTIVRKATTSLKMGLGNELKQFLGIGGKKFEEPCVMGEESIMAPKAHGTSNTPVQENLRWSCDRETADRICNFNRHYAEYRGYWTSTKFVEDAKAEYEEKGEITFYDSNTGKPLYVAPRGRTFQEFVKESLSHGWPSFRDEEVIWDSVRVLPDGETVSVDGTHLGHNLPDSSGNRYCINLVSVAGRPVGEEG